MIPIQKIKLPTPGIEQLHTEAKEEGYKFIDTLVDEWANGSNRFEAPGEVLCGYIDQGTLVAVGGLTIDPFAGDTKTGRIRRIYVRSAWRNRGMGRALVTALVRHAQTHFRDVRLRAVNADAARLYESMGFVPIDNPSATHLLFLNESKQTELDRRLQRATNVEHINSRQDPEDKNQQKNRSTAR
jgi:GNAT superfamily N-acetyltransferase